MMLSPEELLAIVIGAANSLVLFALVGTCQWFRDRRAGRLYGPYRTTAERAIARSKAKRGQQVPW